MDSLRSSVHVVLEEKIPFILAPACQQSLRMDVPVACLDGANQGSKSSNDGFQIVFAPTVMNLSS